MSGYGFSETDCKIILKQIERRAKFRQEFLKLKSDPCKHSQEAGYVVSNYFIGHLFIFDHYITR